MYVLPSVLHVPRVQMYTIYIKLAPGTLIPSLENVYFQLFYSIPLKIFIDTNSLSEENMFLIRKPRLSIIIIICCYWMIDEFSG